jgi:hypothetical protein
MHLSIMEGDRRLELHVPDALSLELRGISLCSPLSCGFSSDGIRETHGLDAIRFERRPRSVAKVTTYLSPLPRPLLPSTTKNVLYIALHKIRTTQSGIFYSV